MSGIEDVVYNPCGGCGASHPDQRCIGCGHDFGFGVRRLAIPPPTPADRERDLAADWNYLGRTFNNPSFMTCDEMVDIAESALRLLAEARRDRDALKAEVARLREALTFYAEPRNYREVSSNDYGHWKSAIEQDDGKRARAALGKDGGT